MRKIVFSAIFGRTRKTSGFAQPGNCNIARSHGMAASMKACRGKKLSCLGQKWNKSISKVRGCIERLFGNLKRNRDLARSRYIGIMKVTQEFFLASLVSNMIRSLSLLSQE